MSKLALIPQRFRRKSTSVEERRSVRSTPDAKKGEGAVSGGGLTGWIRVLASADGEPPYWSQARDTWLREFMYKPNNDLLLGTISTIAARTATSKWFLEGPERTVNVYQKILSRRIGFGAGWAFDITRGVIDFLTQDKGWTEERIRKGKTDTKGGAIGFAHIDSARIMPYRDPEYPIQYQDDERDPVMMHRSQIIRILDMPSPDAKLRGVGMCALSRALTTARILADISRYERERLSDLPPAGILLLNNMTRAQWEDVSKQYDTKQKQQGNKVWRDVMVAFGLNPAVPLQAELLEFSQMPDHFDKRTITEIAIYSFALAFNTDPRELWPVSAGVLGTATEANIQHMKAKAKGHGLVLSLVERAFNDGLSLPPTVSFKFDYQDVEEDERAARIKKLKAQTISILAGTYREGAGGATAIISPDEARKWLIREGYFTAEELAEPMEEEAQAEDTEEAKSLTIVDLGPRVRMWSDGKVERLDIRPHLWRGFNLPAPKSATITNESIVLAMDRWDSLMGQQVE